MNVAATEAPIVDVAAAIIVRDGAILVARRAAGQKMAGLWEFPHVPGALDEAGAGAVLAFWGLRPLEWRQKIEAKHIFTHVEWHMTGYLAFVEKPKNDFAWATKRELKEQFAVPSAFRAFYDKLNKLDI